MIYTYSGINIKFYFYQQSSYKRASENYMFNLCILMDLSKNTNHDCKTQLENFYNFLIIHSIEL